MTGTNYAALILTLLVLNTSLALIANNAMAISPFPQHRSLAIHMHNAVKDALISYAAALGERYVEAEHPGMNVTIQDVVNANTSSPIKSEADYAKALKHAGDAQLLFVELIPLLNTTSPHHVVEIQSGLIMLKNLMDRKAPYNLAEDAVQSWILNHLKEVVQMNATATK
jgi:hypothetical protein